jgi:hypothetical protein
MFENLGREFRLLRHYRYKNGETASEWNTHSPFKIEEIYEEFNQGVPDSAEYEQVYV